MLKLLVMLAMCFGSPTIGEEIPVPIGEATEEPVPTPEIVEVIGCDDSNAANYIPPGEGYVVIGDDSCMYLEGCKDPKAINYFPEAYRDDGSCQYYSGCTDPDAVNYVDFQFYTIDDGSCYWLIGSDAEGWDVSFTDPAPKKKHKDSDTPNSIIFTPDMFLPVDTNPLPIRSYPFNLEGDNPFLQDAVIQEVCQE